ncbi:(2Fe-2S)-binding protein [Sphingobium sp. AS12]|uniref:(2Fe-2S)-binding protein n=1 Tax=Sphingobium sp. AS12 TaxID=2849495 RepID=UPI001C3164E8|nr:(2Fe-2S)-binding protein [Sphingobium sp. AS12]MBV2151215.1 (2Fe-2S)-binding protein [Sphingobium sp. AS12]
MSRFVRLGETDRPIITVHVDGKPVDALEGDTLMVALLSSGSMLRQSEFGPEKRAGFCLMGACQDCWVWTESGDRLRACSTLAASGQQIVTSQPGASWSNHA